MATDPRAFISFDCDNNSTEKILFAGQIKNSRTPFNAQDWSSKTTLPQAQWERLLKEKIGKCHLMIVLVGKSMASATGDLRKRKSCEVTPLQAAARREPGNDG